MPSHVRLDPVSLATEPALWAAAGIVIGLYTFFRGFGLLRRKLLIQSVTSSTVRSAALGLGGGIRWVTITENAATPGGLTYLILRSSSRRPCRPCWQRTHSCRALEGFHMLQTPTK